MKISELIDVLAIASEKYGDLPVEVFKGMSFTDLYYERIGTIKVIRFNQSQEIDVGEDLSTAQDTVLRLKGASLLEEDDDEEDDE